jgi:hypothetical protein
MIELDPDDPPQAAPAPAKAVVKVPQEPTPQEIAEAFPEEGAVHVPAVHGRNGAGDAPQGSGAEQRLVSSCMTDIEGNFWPRARHLPLEAFHDPHARSIWKAMQAGLRFSADEAAFEKATGLTADDILRVQVSGGLGLGFKEWYAEVDGRWAAAEKERLGLELSKCPDGALRGVASRIEALRSRNEEYPATPLPRFGVPDPADKSVLLGDRYLNRGDGMVLSSTSGMGKSSIALQQAVCYALGRPFMGIRPNGPLRSLVVQAEDSDGDIGEVWESLRHMMHLSPAEEALVEERVLIVTERVRRGHSFIDALRRLIARHKPDLVWVNPLQAYIEGDVTDGRDLGDFLRAGLNSLNEPASFAFVLVHHTTKPATGKERAERLWHEVMYDMAGGAEIINWARAIMSLRAAGQKGEFTLVLAKRGNRAGVTREVPQGAGVRDEIVTSIYLKHSEELIELPGRKKRLRAIFWEPRTPDAEETTKAGAGKGAGAPRQFSFATYKDAFPKAEEAATGFRRIHAVARDMKPIGVSAFYSVIDDAVQAGALGVSKDDRGRPRYWLKA